MNITDRRFLFFAPLAVAMMLLPSTSLAQDMPPPPPGGPGGPPPSGWFGGLGGPVLSAASVPVEALAGPLHLTAKQKEQITRIQQLLRNGRGPEGGPPPGGGPPSGSPPDPSPFDQERQKHIAAEKKANTQIAAVLTATQKKALPAVLKDMQTLRSADIPGELLGTLNLSAVQKQKLTKIGTQSRQTMQSLFTKFGPGHGDFETMRQNVDKARARSREQAMAVLTVAQKAQIEKFQSAHPHPNPVGFPG